MKRDTITADDGRLLPLISRPQSLKAISSMDDDWGDVDWDEEGADEEEMEAWREQERESKE